MRRQYEKNKKAFYFIKGVRGILHATKVHRPSGSSQTYIQGKMAELLQELEGKISAATSYEALQYVQSFVARKKKALGRSSTSRCVFHGAKLLVDRGSSGDAGALLEWFIESDDLFHLAGTKKAGIGGGAASSTEKDYCDVDRILGLLRGLSPEKAGPVVDSIYGPLHQVVTVAGLMKGDMRGGVSDRMEQFQRLSADVFEQNKKWFSAYKVAMRLGDTQRGARLLNEWSKQGNITEQPMFFARAVLILLSDKKFTQAEELVRHSTPFIADNVSPPTPSGPSSGPLAIWHLAVILSGLASQPPMQRVDKTRLFSVLYTKYRNVVDKTDPRLHELLGKVGEQTFKVELPADQQRSNPMAMLQQMMMAGGGMGRGGAPSSSGSSSGGGGEQVDYASIIQHLARLEAAGGKGKK